MPPPREGSLQRRRWVRRKNTERVNLDDHHRLVEAVTDVLGELVAAGHTVITFADRDDSGPPGVVVTPRRAGAAAMELAADFGFISIAVGEHEHVHALTTSDGWERRLQAIVAAVASGAYSEETKGGVAGPVVHMRFVTEAGDVTVTHADLSGQIEPSPLRRYAPYAPPGAP